MKTGVAGATPLAINAPIQPVHEAAQLLLPSSAVSDFYP
tara:strand:+ start:162 stop:278 length:117 start_codon:yes stop_codon:yes gene_type:complete